ncbi:DUF86 domain-containing protein [Thermofilum pendens]|uniref:DUF86 domain-containing protein n=1 Tax=Thermofilum pendens (strain DSM 2475 / Hrk 5) TaxID=368408 RepID=A1RZM1_THEPD|nr:HepT-like ribonuclease domain-containing protein [Thermofilum pendens]ABL78651.1 protein of unknown function DUF86 [Thermofilum pendens Hrk 5]
MSSGELSAEDKALVRKVLYEVEQALGVLRLCAERGVRDLADAFALRYAVIQVVEGLAVIASRLAELRGTVVEGYVEAMSFLARAGIVDPAVGEELVRLARLRNLLVHRYWEVSDEKILEEARKSGVKTVEEAVKSVRRFVEG